jgi:polyhydroxyalkanoate synthesis regulator phasin
MRSIQLGDQVVTMAPNGDKVEVYTVVKVLADGVQVDGASGKLSKAELRVYNKDTVNQIQEKEGQLKAIKREIRSLYDRLDEVG